MLLAWLSASFWSLPPLPTSKLGPSGADSQVGGIVYVPESCSSHQQALLWGWESLPPLQPPQVLQPDVLRVFFSPALETWLAQSILLPNCSSPFIHMQTWDHLVLQPPPCGEFSLSWLPVYIPPTSLDECFFFNSLVVGLPYSSSFWQIWVVLVLNLLLSFFWLCKEAKCIYPCHHLGW